jgi:hypothetical protein
MIFIFEYSTIPISQCVDIGISIYYRFGWPMSNAEALRGEAAASSGGIQSLTVSSKELEARRLYVLHAELATRGLFASYDFLCQAEAERQGIAFDALDVEQRVTIALRVLGRDDAA